MFLHYEIYVVLEVLHFTQKHFSFLFRNKLCKNVSKIDIQKAVNVFIWKTVVKVNWRMLFQTHFRETQWRSKR